MDILRQPLAAVTGAKLNLLSPTGCEMVAQKDAMLPSSSGKWSAGPEDTARIELVVKMQKALVGEKELLANASFKGAWDNLELWLSSKHARDTPVNLGRLEAVEHGARQAMSELKDPRCKVKACRLLVLASYHLVAYSSGAKGGEDERWGSGKAAAQVILAREVFGMTELQQALGKEGSSLTAALGRLVDRKQRTRRELVVLALELSDLVFALRPLSRNDLHPPPPVLLEATVKAMIAAGWRRRWGSTVGHLLAVSGSAPLDSGVALKEAHAKPVTAVKWLPGSNSLTTGGEDGVLAVWDVGSGKLIKALKGHAGASVGALDVFWSAELVAGASKGLFPRALSGGADGGLRVHDLSSHVAPERSTLWEVPAAHGGSAVTCCAAFFAGGAATSPMAVSGGSDGTLRLWGLGSSGEATGGLCAAEVHNGEEVEEDGEGVDEASCRHCIATFDGHFGGVTCLAAYTAADGADGADGANAEVVRAVSGGADRRVKVWGLSPCGERRATPLLSLEGHDAKVNCVRAFYSSSSSSLSSSSSGVGSSPPYRVHVTPIANRALSGSDDGCLRVWDIAMAPLAPTTPGSEAGSLDSDAASWRCGVRCVAVLAECYGAVWACGVFANGTKALSASDDTVLRVWDLATGGCDHSVPGHPHRDYCLEVFDGGSTLGCPDGGSGVGGGVGRCVTGGDGEGGGLKLWHLPTGPSQAFALSPAVVPTLMQALSPKPKKKRRPSTKAAAAGGAGGVGGGGTAPAEPMPSPLSCPVSSPLASPLRAVGLTDDLDEEDCAPVALSPRSQADADMYQQLLLAQMSAAGSLDAFGQSDSEDEKAEEEGEPEEAWGEAGVKLNIASLF